jgi:DNA-binding IclR family transcriptional regulator/acyl dehydratase
MASDVPRAALSPLASNLPGSALTVSMARPTAPAADLAARILRLLSGYHKPEATLTAISVELGAPKASCRRVLAALRSHGLIQYDPDTRGYALGPYAVVIGARAERNIEYADSLRPLLREAAERTGWTAVLIQPIGTNRMMYVAKHEPTDQMRVGVSIGSQFPVTYVSYGKWLLAYAEEDVRAAILANGLPGSEPSDAGAVRPEEYLAQLQRVRGERVLLSRDEYVPGIAAVSCPVFDVHERFIGVLAVLGLDDPDDDSISAIVYAMREISEKCHLSRAESETVSMPDHDLRPTTPVASSVVTERRVSVDPVDLFFFSAACWLPHRIHYDADFAQSEGLEGTPVHGPLQAAWLSELVSDWAKANGGRLVSLSVRNLRPAYPTGSLTCRASMDGHEPGPGGEVYSFTLSVEDADQHTTSEGSARVLISDGSQS